VTPRRIVRPAHRCKQSAGTSLSRLTHRQCFPATLSNRRAHDAELVRGISRIVRGGICMSRTRRIAFRSAAGDSSSDTPTIASPCGRTALRAANFKQCLALDLPAFFVVYRAAPNFSRTTSSRCNQCGGGKQTHISTSMSQTRQTADKGLNRAGGGIDESSVRFLAASWRARRYRGFMATPYCCF
jgi:hypothetical protein